MEIIERKDGIKIINDCYNANYDSMKAALEYLGKIHANKKIAILGDMGELGEYAKELHEKVGEEIYNNKIDILITVGDNAKYFANKAISLGMNKNNIYIYENKEKAIEKAKKIMKRNDYILVKASKFMGFTEIIQELTA